MKYIIFALITSIAFFPVSSQNIDTNSGFQYVVSSELIEKYINSEQTIKQRLDEINKELQQLNSSYLEYKKLHENDELNQDDYDKVEDLRKKMEDLQSEYNQALSSVIEKLNIEIQTVADQKSFKKIIDFSSIQDNMFVVGSKDIFSGYGHNINPIILENLNIPSSNEKASKTAGRFGYIEVEQIVRLMPEYKKGTAKLEQLSKEYDTEMNVLYDELTKKMEEETISYEEMTAQKNTIVEYTALLSKSLEDEQTKIFNPIMARLRNSCQLVANENNINTVIDLGGLDENILIIGSPENIKQIATNLTIEVKQKLGL